MDIYNNYKSQKKIKSICIILFIFCTALLSAEKKSIIILVPNSTSSIPLFYLAEKDPFKNIDIQTEIFINHAQGIARLLRGEADMILTGTSQGWENHLAGGPLLMVNTGIWGVSYLIGHDASIKSFKDLKGYKIAIPFPGSPLDFQTRYFLKNEGINSETELTINYSPIPQTAAKLLLKKIDAAPLPEPLASSLVIDKGLKRLIDYKEMWGKYAGGCKASPQVSMFILKNNADSEADFLIDFVIEWKNSSKYISSHPEEAASNFAGTLSFSEDVITTAIKHTFYDVPTFENNRSLVVAYYNQVKNAVQPANKEILKKGFFFLPSK